MLKHPPEWRVLAYRRGQGMVSKIFSSYLAEDGVILLLPLVRVRFAVEPAQWIQWTFLTAPRYAMAGDRVLGFQIDRTGRPIRME